MPALSSRFALDGEQRGHAEAVAPKRKTKTTTFFAVRSVLLLAGTRELPRQGEAPIENELMHMSESTSSSSSQWRTAFNRGRVNLHSMDGWLEERFPDWPRVWAACVRRTHAWRVPPRWSPRDWWEELDAESIASACHAMRIFDPERGPSLGSFLYHQIIAGALSRYRQEWNYAQRYGLSQSSEDHLAGMDDVESRFVADQDEKRLKRLMTDLPESDRRLIESIFWDGRTETEVAGGLGISQQAVCKRKHKILRKLRSTLAKTVGN
jgi:RNA polymerase sigma factor (sigma-70 family)